MEDINLYCIFWKDGESFTYTPLETQEKYPEPVFCLKLQEDLTHPYLLTHHYFSLSVNNMALEIEWICKVISSIS